MKNTSIFLLLLFSAINLKAQDFLISFAGTGASTTVDSVKVENLTQGKSLSVGGLETLHLAKTITGINQSLDYENKFRIYPNPMTDNSNIDFVATAPGIATIELFDVIGKRVGKIQNILTIGAHSFNVCGLCRGIFTVRINSNAYTYMGKLISKREDGSDVKICYNGKRDISIAAKSLTIASVEKSMQYSTGDQLKITGKSGNFSTVYTDIPTQSKTITFNFVPCTDADGNNYTVVQIGSQVWMAENLNTTRYRNGDSIPNKIGTSAWLYVGKGAYCNYDNNSDNSVVYGKLYNWYAVNDNRNLAPAGWHVPTDSEFVALADYVASAFGGKGMVGKALASAFTWTYDGWAGTIGNDLTKNNSTGFTALPGGYRGVDGMYGGVGSFGGWWSTTVNDSSQPCSRYLQANDRYLGQVNLIKQNGYSIRCLKD